MTEGRNMPRTEEAIIVVAEGAIPMEDEDRKSVV